MKRIIFPLISIVLIFSLIACTHKKEETKEQKNKLAQLKNEISGNLTNNILPYWSTKMIDTINGGFYGRVDSKEQVHPDADKGGILNARILWTFSSAFRVLRDSSYLRLAASAKDYILKHFIDKEYGGVFTTVKSNGEPADTRKQVLTQSYFIYALAEYYRATGDQEALEKAKEIFFLLEKYAYDKESNGYFEVYTRDWNRSHDLMLGEKTPKDEKTMITHLHLVEAYAGLFKAWPEKQMADRLRNVIEVFNTRIVDNKTFHLIYFLDKDWNSTSSIDSYGHDIEASWLIVEAAGLLKDPEFLAAAQEISVKLADAAAEGIQDDGSMLTEKNTQTGHIVTIRSWWEQAEAIIGYLNAFELTGDEEYLDKSLKSWDYIKQYFVDNTNGGWYALVLETGEPGARDKAGFWTCPYHNGRMCLEVIERIR